MSVALTLFGCFNILKCSFRFGLCFHFYFLPFFYDKRDVIAFAKSACTEATGWSPTQDFCRNQGKLSVRINWPYKEFIIECYILP